MSLRFVPLLLLLVSPLSATTVQRFDLETLTQNAVHIFVGTCQSATPEWVEGQPSTRYCFAVTETLKGKDRQTLEISLPGGQSSGLRLCIPGMPSFVPGEELILFLTAENPLGQAWPVGLGQGKFRIERRGAAKQARVYQELDGLTLYPAASAKQTGQGLDGFPLDRFLGQVRDLISPSSDSAGRDDER